MKKNLHTLGYVVIGGLVAVLLHGCQGATEDTNNGGSSGKVSAAVSACMKADRDYVEATIGRRSPLDGGLFYDKWWEELGLEVPAGDQPLWATRDTGGADINSATGADTWRCKECHGWDYKGKDGVYGSGGHYTGFDGLMAAADKDPVEVFCSIKAEDDHSFGDYMEDDDILRLTAFITDTEGLGIADYDPYLNADKSSKGDATAGEALFVEIGCGAAGSCHSDNGSLNADVEGLGGISQDNPWEFLHKIRFGAPGNATMVTLEDSSYTKDDFADILAYAQTLPNFDADTGGDTPVTGDVVRGGLLYDDWATVIELEGATLAAELSLTNPLYDLRSQSPAQPQSGATTWRCKECHGWDYKGVDGAYGTGSHLTGFGGVINAASTKSETEILRIITDGFKNPANGQTVHNFGMYMDAADLAALTAFVAKGAIDMDAYISASTKIAFGDSAQGASLYVFNPSKPGNPSCSACHGLDGKAIDFAHCATLGGNAEYLGDLARDNPWEVLHKARFGQPEAPEMPSVLNMGFTNQDAADILTHAQGLAAATACP